MSNYITKKFPDSRIATKDVSYLGVRKHHIVALIEVDVTVSREKVSAAKMAGKKVSFTSWLIKEIGACVKQDEEVASYLSGKRKRIIFGDVNVSMAVEKNLNGEQIPIPLLIEKVNERNIESIYNQIEEAKASPFTGNEIVLQRKEQKGARIYNLLPGPVRRIFWHYMLRHPKFAFPKMGNVAITSIGMIGKADGWFIPISIHPLCFGIGRISKKPAVINDKIEVREMLKMTILLDHDVIDGGLMARFISKLTAGIEVGNGL